MKRTNRAMKAWKVGYVVAALVAVAGVFVGGRARSVRAKASAERAVWVEKAAVLRKELAEEEKVQRETVGGGTPAAGDGRKGGAEALSETREERWRRDARLQVKLIELRRAGMFLRYGTFLRERKLSAAEKEKLGTAWEAFQAMQLDADAIGRDLKLAAGDKALQVQREQARREMMAVEKAVLGEQGYGEFTRFKRSQPLRAAVGIFAGKAALLGMPLTVEQGQLVAEVLAEADPNYRVHGSADDRRLDWAGGLENARRFLSTEQHELLVSEMDTRRTAAALAKMTDAIKAERESARNAAESAR